MGTLMGREPAAIAAFISIAVNLAITFGLKLSADQVALVNALVVAGLALIVRQSVTPISEPQLKSGTVVKVQDGPGSTTV